MKTIMPPVMIPLEAPSIIIGQDIYAKVTGIRTNEKMIKAILVLCLPMGFFM
ncbi:MAG TPA: hypothetical protein PLY52_08480 [Methanothrix sp.]|uniref:hypothetical protein n=1 Tax=Methanothrix sp. TaxID=90426 RepID=UPI002B760F05|nr:hypothetical protein [Methanothrix sp.]